MNTTGRKLYYLKSTGEVILTVQETFGSVRETTWEEDFDSFIELKERVPETIGLIRLEVGNYSEDFLQCTSYRVNPKTKQIEFSYPDSSEESQEPVYQAPLSEKVAQLEQENKLLKAQNNALTERTDFHEEVLTEIILTINS